MSEYKTHHYQNFSDYTVSVSFDWKLYAYDIQASIAHAKMLSNQNIITHDDSAAIVSGLELIEQEINDGKFVWQAKYEDLHMNIEARLYELIGDPAAKLHTGRSRNDQVATATRLYVRDAIDSLLSCINELQTTLVDLASNHTGTLLPGYTHLQRAQPVFLAHHLLAYFEMLDRDASRFKDARKRVNVLPLGSGALAGVPYPLNRKWVAKELEFDEITANSMDAVADRDYIVEFLANASLCMMHLSRLAEEIILWSSSEFNFLQIGSQWTTGSSIMPQKRNPDYAEITRGKTGRIYGNLIALLTTLKALPLTYNRDLQEDKQGLFDTHTTLLAACEVMNGMLKDSQFNTHRMQSAAEDSSLLATDFADYLVAKGLPFREAHSIVSNLCDLAAVEKISIINLPLDTLLEFSSLFSEDIYEITPFASASSRDLTGGTSPNQVLKAIEDAKKRLGVNNELH